MKLPPTLPLRDADRDGIGNKARRLARLLRLRPSLFRVPDGIVITPAFSAPDHGSELDWSLAALNHGAGGLAVRSAALDEDDPHHSGAGRYRTELDVTRDRVADAIASVRASFGNGAGAVLIQPMIRPRLAGVVFTRSPENAGLALCEFTSGTADALVAGRVVPARVEYGRWSGKLYGVPHGVDTGVLARVFLVAMIIEEALAAAQDIEWAWDEKHRHLCVLQSRDITASTYRADVQREQVRAAELVLATRDGAAGRSALHSAGVREVVTEPTRLTRSLLERLYSPAGSLGRALDRLGLPQPRTARPYVTSVFGRLYAVAEVERRLFGPGWSRWRAVRAIRGRMRADPNAVRAALAADVQNIPESPRSSEAPAGDAVVAARRLLDHAGWFIEEVYPPAFATTLMAQLAHEPPSAGAAAGQMFRDLSRLHHTGEIRAFLERWGHRSRNDYELSAPRFNEAPEETRAWAARFADLPWDDRTAEHSFTDLKEAAKDRAIRCLGVLRRDALHLAEALGIPPRFVFALSLEDLEPLAGGTADGRSLAALAEQRHAEEQAWSTIDLGDQVSIETVERLEPAGSRRGGLRGRMVGAPVAFEGVARFEGSSAGSGGSASQVLVTSFLKPELVARFPSCSGCIAEVGGTLSHAAIVAREMGFPVLVLPGSTTTLRDGDRIEVGADGTIRLERVPS